VISTIYNAIYICSYNPEDG